MQRKGKMAVSAILVTGMGLGAWMMYKKMNPCVVSDMKMMIKDMTNGITSSSISDELH